MVQEVCSMEQTATEGSLTPQNKLACELALRDYVVITPQWTESREQFTLESSDPIIVAGVFEYGSGEEAVLSPLAQKVLALPNVRSIRMMRDEITIRLAEPMDDWREVSRAVVQVVREHLKSGVPAIATAAYPPGLQRAEAGPEEDERVRQLIAGSIAEVIAPMLAGHGGGIELLGVKNYRAWVRLLGGCQGCPSAAMTLKMGVERQLREVVPELIEVINMSAACTDDSCHGNTCG
jgi:Fe-S cluster biogenesis protein NfuA